MAAIYDYETGDEITVGLQGCDVCDEAIQAAQRIADDRGEDVHLVDDDGEWIVHPAKRTNDAWWAWHDADQARWSQDVEEAETRCAAWVAGESNDGPDAVRELADPYTSSDEE